MNRETPMTLTRRTVLTASAALAAARPAAAQGAATLAIGVVSDPVTLDPAFSASFFENAVMYCLHETLLVAAPDGTITPGLATHASPDPLRHVLTLREGLTFHDGTVLDAASVKANLDRYLDPATASIRKADFGPIAEVAVTGPRTVELRMSAPYAPLPLVLTNRAGMIVSMEALKRLGPDFATRAVGCGPYRFASWTKNSELVLEKFDGYWRGAGHGFERLVFRSIPDETVRLANLRSGTLQLIDGVPPQAVAGLAREASVKVSQMPGLGFNAWSMNVTRAPFADPRVRRAFVAAVDPEVVQRVVYFGTGRVAHGPLSPAVPWAFDPGFAPPGFDPARARGAAVRGRGDAAGAGDGHRDELAADGADRAGGAGAGERGRVQGGGAADRSHQPDHGPAATGFRRVHVAVERALRPGREHVFLVHEGRSQQLRRI